MDPLTGRPAEVVMRFVRLEPGRVREALGVDPSAKKLPAHHAQTTVSVSKTRVSHWCGASVK